MAITDPYMTFADLLYELQVDSGLGVRNYVPARKVMPAEGEIEDYRPFYHALKLDAVIRYDDFVSVCRDIRKPTPELVACVGAWIDEHYESRAVFKQNFRHLSERPEPRQPEPQENVKTSRSLPELIDSFLLSKPKGRGQWHRFVQSLANDWEIGANALGAKLGVPNTSIKRWLGDAKSVIEPQSVAAIARHCELDEAYTEKLLHIGRGVAKHAFGPALKRYIERGGTQWSEFLLKFQHQNGFTQIGFSMELGIQQPLLAFWTQQAAKGNEIRPTQQMLDVIARHMELSPELAEKMRLLCCGDTTPLHEKLRAAQERMKDMTPEQRALEGRRLAGEFITQSGLQYKELAHRTRASLASITQLVNHMPDTPPSSQAIPLLQRVAFALCPEGDEVQRRDLALLFVGIPEYRTPQQMMESLRNGEITAGAMLREFRMQLCKNTDEVAKIVGTSSHQKVAECERAPSGTPRPSVLNGLADLMGLSEEDKADFLRAALGKNRQIAKGV